MGPGLVVVQFGYQLAHETGIEVVGPGPLHCEVVGVGPLHCDVVVGPLHCDVVVGPLHCEVVVGAGVVLRGGAVVGTGVVLRGSAVVGLGPAPGTLDPGGGTGPVPP